MDDERSLTDVMTVMGARAQAAARILASTPPEQKSNALRAAAAELSAREATLQSTNELEVRAAEKRGVKDAFLDRMALNAERIAGICQSLLEIADQDDPVGRVIAAWERPNGLKISRVATPIGVIGVIFESRPNVTIDAGAICLKSGNAAILRGGSECIETNTALFSCLQAGIVSAGLPGDAVQLVQTTDRAAVGALLGGLDGAVDLVIPRGGKSLVARVQNEARVAVLSHLDGICHVYVDRDADADKAVAITLNSKMRRTGVCGAAETLLIDKAALATFLPPIANALREAGCALRGDRAVRAIDDTIDPANEEDWVTEYLAPILSIAAVDGVDGAIAHIAKYSSGHTEAIITENENHAARFLADVDSAIVLHNASTQYADGGEFGLGAEIGISTGKLHARGPVGAAELTSYKNVVRGTGQVRP